MEMAKKGKDVTSAVRTYYKDAYINGSETTRGDIESVLESLDEKLEEAGYDLYKKDIDKVLEDWLD